MIYLVRFKPDAGVDGIHAMRALLKIARRRLGLIALDAVEEPDSPSTRARRPPSEVFGKAPPQP
jgi:hypothetical protein